MPAISEGDKTVEAAADLLKKMKMELPPSVKGKLQWLEIIKKLRTTLSNGEQRVATQGPPRVAEQGRPRVTGEVTTSTSPTCPRILRTKPRIHQRQTRRNTPVTEITATDPPPNGEGLRQTQNTNMGSARAEPGDSPEQTQNNNKRKARAEPVPEETATKSRRASPESGSPRQTQNINKGSAT